VVERQPSKLNVAGSSPVSRSGWKIGPGSSEVEHLLGKEVVVSSILILGSGEKSSLESLPITEE
jgi:hypothetical protein